MLSIIIPALNEQENLKNLLDSIKVQGDFGDYEIIVADAGSKDKTKEVAIAYNCIICQGGLPAKGRNEGAKIAKGDWILFLDADTMLPKNFFVNTFKEVNERNLSIASYKLLPTSNNKKATFYLNFFYNWPIEFLQNILPHGADGILIKKNIFEKVNGFDESVKLAEDHYMIRLACKIGKFGIIKNSSVYISERRFVTDGWVRTGIKYLLCELHMIFLGPVKSNIFNYKFNHYK